MKLSVIKNAVTSKVGRQLLLAQKHSPVIMFSAGVVGVVATAILASRATLKIDEILEEHDDALEKIDRYEGSDYSDEERQRDKVVVYFRTGAKFARVYAPALLVGGLSIAALTGAHITLNRRYAGAAAAYTALDKGFRAYRERVKDELGMDKDREFMYGMEDHTIIKETAEGPVTQVIKRPGKKLSVYARFFDDGNKHWVNNHNYNQMFISCQQNWANDLLRARGHVFLSEVYDMLGIERSRESVVVGWILGNGDDYIDFGVFDNDLHSGLLFVNGDEPSILLDFNVDGIIWDKI